MVVGAEIHCLPQSAIALQLTLLAEAVLALPPTLARTTSDLHAARSEEAQRLYKLPVRQTLRLRRCDDAAVKGDVAGFDSGNRG